MEKEYLAKLLLGILVGLLIMMATSQILTSSDRATSINKCKLWIAEQSTPLVGKTFGIKSFGAFDSNAVSNCETWNTEIKQKTEEDVYRDLAEEMRLCWEMYGKGEKNWFSDWSWLGNTIPFYERKSEQYCLVCSQVKFDEDTAKLMKNKIEVDKLWRYMATHSINQGKISTYKEQTYTEYFLKTKNVEIDTNEGIYELGTALNISNDKPLFVTFHITKFDKSILVTAGNILTLPIGGAWVKSIKLAEEASKTAKVALWGGKLLAKGATSSKVTIAGFASGVLTAGDAYIVPSLVIFENDPNDKETIKSLCSNSYYKPREGFFDKINSKI